MEPSDLLDSRSNPVYLIPKPERFVAAEAKNTGRSGIRRDLANMDDRLDYLDELRGQMEQEIQNTEMVSCPLSDHYHSFQ